MKKNYLVEIALSTCVLYNCSSESEQYDEFGDQYDDEYVFKTQNDDVEKIEKILNNTLSSGKPINENQNNQLDKSLRSLLNKSKDKISSFFEQNEIEIEQKEVDDVIDNLCSVFVVLTNAVSGNNINKEQNDQLETSLKFLLDKSQKLLFSSLEIEQKEVKDVINNLCSVFVIFTNAVSGNNINENQNDQLEKSLKLLLNKSKKLLFSSSEIDQQKEDDVINSLCSVFVVFTNALSGNIIDKDQNDQLKKSLKDFKILFGKSETSSVSKAELKKFIQGKIRSFRPRRGLKVVLPEQLKKRCNNALDVIVNAYCDGTQEK